MAQRVKAIVSNPDVLHGEPRIEDRRISVRQIVELVEEADLSAQTVADRYRLDVADVYAALAYFHSHPEVMAAVERERAESEAAAREGGFKSLKELRADPDSSATDA